jgi:hypothetical protein
MTHKIFVNGRLFMYARNKRGKPQYKFIDGKWHSLLPAIKNRGKMDKVRQIAIGKAQSVLGWIDTAGLNSQRKANLYGSQA